MKSYLYNIGYFVKETGNILRLNLFSNLISLLGTGLVLFLLGLVFAGTAAGNQLVAMLSNEAEISAYLYDDMTTTEVGALVEQIQELEGVQEARLVSKEEAMEQMKEVLKEEAEILDLFDQNPFEAYVEVGISIDGMEHITDQVKELEGIEYIRDNREVLEQIQRITGGIKLLGYLIVLAVGITTSIIISHMIRQGIYNNKDQINTLRLLGASKGFLGLPYLIYGVLLVLLGGIMATLMLMFLLNGFYNNISSTISFIPLPPKQELINNIAILLPTISVILGVIGSVLGLTTIREK